jgi:hypothetical protein
MRADMAKVIVERPRIGSRGRGKPKGYRKALQKLSDDGPPSREGMRRRWQGQTKGLNEHLGPLRRYLNAQVGRPWDKVFSEICAHINRNSAVQDHVRDHVEDYVTTHVVLVDGVPCHGVGREYGEPLHAQRWMLRYWYVCPRTGLLRRITSPKRRSSGRAPKKDYPRFVRVNEALVCKRIEGAWYLVDLRPLPSLLRDRDRVRDVVLDRPASELYPAKAEKHYGAAVYATGKRRMSRGDLKQSPIPAGLWT